MSARSSPSLGSRNKTDVSEDVAAVSEDAPEAAAKRAREAAAVRLLSFPRWQKDAEAPESALHSLVVGAQQRLDTLVFCALCEF